MRIGLLAVAALLALAAPASAQSGISSEHCQRLNEALAMWSYDIVRLGAVARGFTEEQLRWAMAHCASRAVKPANPKHGGGK